MLSVGIGDSVEKDRDKEKNKNESEFELKTHSLKLEICILKAFLPFCCLLLLLLLKVSFCHLVYLHVCNRRLLYRLDCQI